MQIECIDSNGFEDLLTEDLIYRVDALQGNSVKPEDNSGRSRWYGRLKFSQPSCYSCAPVQAA